MLDFDGREKRFLEITYILTNGYTQKEKIRELEKRGIEIEALHGQTQEDSYTVTIKDLEERFCF